MANNPVSRVDPSGGYVPYGVDMYTPGRLKDIGWTADQIQHYQHYGRRYSPQELRAMRMEEYSQRVNEINWAALQNNTLNLPETAQALDALKDEYGVSRGVGSIRQSTPADFGLGAPGGDNEMGLSAAYNNYADYAEDMEQASKMGELVTYELDQIYEHGTITNMNGYSSKEITGYSFHFNTKRVKYSSNNSGPNTSVGYAGGVLPIDKENRSLYPFSFPKGFIVSFEPDRKTAKGPNFTQTADRLRIFRPTKTHQGSGIPTDPFKILDNNEFQFEENREYFFFNQMQPTGGSQWMLGSFLIEHPNYPGEKLYWTGEK